MTDLTPGDRFLLPVEFSHLSRIADLPVFKVNRADDVVLPDTEDLIPRDYMDELKAAVIGWKSLYEEAFVPSRRFRQLEAQLELTRDASLERDRLAHQWMQRHDALAALCPAAIRVDAKLPPFPSPAPPDRITELEAEVSKLRNWFQGLEPHLDSVICYASTIDEHLPNKIVLEVRAYLQDHGEKEAG